MSEPGMRDSDAHQAVCSAMSAMGLAPTAQDSAGSCPECGCQGRLVDGVMACWSCGEVLGRYLDSAPEWTRDGTMKLERCGAAVSELFPCGNACYMAPRSQESRKALRMQGWGGMSYGKRKLCKAMIELTAEARAMGLCESVATRAKHIYLGVTKDAHMHGTRRAGLVEGCLYAALQGTAGAARDTAELPGDLRATGSGIKRVLRITGGSQTCSAESYVARRRGELSAIGNVDVACEVAALFDSLDILPRYKPPTRAAACAIIALPDSDANAIAAAMGCTRSSAAKCLEEAEPFLDEIRRICGLRSDDGPTRRTGPKRKKNAALTEAQTRSDARIAALCQSLGASG